MKIGGFLKQSLIDYPGKIAAVVFTQGCNFRCGYCHNPQLVLPRLFQEHPDLLPINIINYLEKHTDWLDGVVVTGGEPSIHKDLPEFLAQIKRMGYAVKLDTNGSNPYMLDRIVKAKLVDHVAMDIKILLEEQLYAKITQLTETADMVEHILASVMVLRNADIEVEFRTTFIPGVHNEQMIQIIKNYVGADKRYTVNEYRDGPTIDSHYLTLHRSE